MARCLATATKAAWSTIWALLGAAAVAGLWLPRSERTVFLQAGAVYLIVALGSATPVISKARHRMAARWAPWGCQLAFMLVLGLIELVSGLVTGLVLGVFGAGVLDAVVQLLRNGYGWTAQRGE